MTLPATLAEIMSMGRDALHAIVRLYIPVFGLQPWEITAQWVEPAEAGNGEVVAGFCEPNARYQRATIGVAWPPVGDLEETVVHELAHCFTARLAYAAGAGTDAWALDEWEHIAEQAARGMVALRRSGERVPHALSRVVPRTLARVFRSKVAALRRDRMDPVKLAELAMKAGEMAAREDVPEDVRGLLSEFVAALAGGGGEPEVPAATEADPTDPNAPPMATEDDDSKAPAYMRKIAGQLKDLQAVVTRLAPVPATPAPALAAVVSPEILEARRLAVETFLSTKAGIVSPEMERQLVEKGDMKLARAIVAEVERRPVQRSGVTPGPDGKPAVKLTDMQKAAARRHKLSDEQFAAQLQRQAGQQKMLARGDK